MRKNTHSIVGSVGYTASMYLFIHIGHLFNTNMLIVLSIFVALMTSRLPDIDNQIDITHIEETHSLLACLLVEIIPLLLFVLYPWLAQITYAIFIGYLLHVFADAFTDNGVRWHNSCWDFSLPPGALVLFQDGSNPGA